MSSRRNGIFDEIATRKPRRKVEIKYSTDGIVFFVLAGIFGFLIILAISSYFAGVIGCNCSSYRAKPKVIAVEEDLASDRFFATDNYKPSENLQRQIEEMKQALTIVNNSVQDLNTRLARDEQLLDNTQANVGRIERSAGATDSRETNYAQETLTKHLGKIDATKRVLRDLENTLNANPNEGTDPDPEEVLMDN